MHLLTCIHTTQHLHVQPPAVAGSISGVGVSMSVARGQGISRQPCSMHYPRSASRLSISDTSKVCYTLQLQAAASAVFGVLAAIGANIAGAGDGLGRLLSRLAAEARAAL